MSASHTFFPDCGLAEVKACIDSEHIGQIFFQSTFWLARCADGNSDLTLLPGTPVRVVGREGLVQLITPLQSCTSLN